MTNYLRPHVSSLGLLTVALICSFVHVTAAVAANENDSPALIQTADLAQMLQAPKSPKPLIIQVGFRVLYEQAHVPGSEYLGPASSAEAIAGLEKRVAPLARNAPIILYCGCCPWTRCPNVRPAYQALRHMGFSNVKVLYIPQDFGSDWVSKGYPVEKAQ